MVYKCRAQTEDGTLCKRHVTRPDTRCYQHLGRPAGRINTPVKRVPRRTPTQPRAPRVIAQRRTTIPATPRQPGRAAPDRRGQEYAAALCVDLLSTGGAATIADRATSYVSDETWKALAKHHRRRNCDDIAELARNILDKKERLHRAIGQTAGGIFGLLGRSPIERVFAYELARRIPLPIDAKLSAAARGLQVAGIYVCFVNKRKLADCACLQDVLKEKGKSQLESLMQGALDDWSGFPARMKDAPIPWLNYGA